MRCRLIVSQQRLPCPVVNGCIADRSNEQCRLTATLSSKLLTVVGAQVVARTLSFRIPPCDKVNKDVLDSGSQT